MGVVEGGQVNVLASDVAPHIELGPVGQRKHPDVLAGAMPAVVEVPQLGPLVARVPGTELVTQAEDALLGPGLLLVATTSAEDGVESVARDRVEQRLRLQRVAGAVGALGQAAIVDVLLNQGYLEAHALVGHGPVSYTHIRAHETVLDLVCRLLL